MEGGEDFEKMLQYEAQYGRVINDLQEIGDKLKALAAKEEDPATKLEINAVADMAWEASGALRLEGNTEQAESFIKSSIDMIEDLDLETESSEPSYNMLQTLKELLKILEAEPS